MAANFNLNRCAACKFMNCACLTTCVFAPHFPSTEPEKFERVRIIFGAEQVHNILSLAKPWERDITVSALSYEAEARLHDSTFGYFGVYLDLKSKLNSVNEQIASAKNELAAAVGADNVPRCSELPNPDDLRATRAALAAFIQRMGGLTQEQKDRLKQLPVADAQRILDTIFRRRGNGEEASAARGADGPSTSAGPSVAPRK